MSLIDVILKRKVNAAEKSIARPAPVTPDSVAITLARQLALHRAELSYYRDQAKTHDLPLFDPRQSGFKG